MAQTKDAQDFRILMESYFEDVANLTHAAKCVGLADLPPKAMLATLWGLIDVMDKTAREARKDLANQSRREMMEASQGRVVGLRA